MQIIKSKSRSIKSGWHSVFMVFTAAADDELESTVESAFENVEQGKIYPFFPVIVDLMLFLLFCLF